MAPGEPVIKLGQLLVPCQVHFLVYLPRTRAAGDGCAHVHEAEGAAGQGLAASGAAGDLGLGGRAAHTVLAEAAALVGHRRAAVGDGLPTEVTAHKHLRERL